MPLTHTKDLFAKALKGKYALGAFNRDGAAAEFTLISKEFLAPKPKTLDPIQAACVSS